LKTVLERLLDGQDLSDDEAEALLVDLTAEDLSPALGGAILAALRAKGETGAEVRGFARGMRKLARSPGIQAGERPAVDVVGTGGDGSGSFNLSTGSALLATACGLRVVKHGNRSISSRSGSADVLEVLGLPMPLSQTDAARCVEQTGFTFLFAPHYHPAMKTVGPIRRAMGVRTVFNLLGPLTNPAEPPFLMLGAYSEAAAQLMAEALVGLPVERAFVVHGEPGWDEATPVGPFVRFEVREGRVSRQVLDPRDHGVERCAPEDLAGGEAADNARALRAVFEGEQGAHRDALSLGAGMVLELVGEVEGLAAGVAAARAALDDGRAVDVLTKLAAFGQELSP
jgi:anthranilate phosphoribosyltransferase